MNDSFIPDKIILGHNQFFGTDHMSSVRGAERATYFSNIDNVIKIIKYAHERGANGLMLSTHENSKLILEKIIKDDDLKNNLNIYVLLPYLAKYVKLANERGMVNMVLEILGGASFKDKLGIMSAGSFGLLKKDISSMLKALIDIELLPFKKVNMKAVFLHNSLTDLMIGLKLDEIALFFNNYIAEKFNVSPAFCTLNSSLVINYLDFINIKNPLIMAPFNSAGFQMNPSKNEVEKSLKKKKSRMIAMSTLAAGYIGPQEAYQYISTQDNIKSIVVGASSKKHIKETINYINSSMT